MLLLLYMSIEAGARIEAGSPSSESLIEAGSRIKVEFTMKPGLESTQWHSAASEVNALECRVQNAA